MADLTTQLTRFLTRLQASVGLGAPTFAAQGRTVGAVAAVTSVATHTPAADGSFIVSANILVTTATNHSFTTTVTYKDTGGTARTLTVPFVLVAGTAITTTIGNASGTVPYHGIPLHVRAQAGTAITVATTGTFTTVVYNVEATIQKLA